MSKSIRCPKCKSVEARSIGYSSGVGNGPMPVINSLQYQCNNCKKRFQVKGMKTKL